MNLKFGRAGSPLHAVVAMPNAEGITTMTNPGSLAPQRGEISPNRSSRIKPMNLIATVAVGPRK